MKKMLIVAALAAVLPQLAAAQVEKQVEVTKAYVPKVESASKLAVHSAGGSVGAPSDRKNTAGRCTW